MDTSYQAHQTFNSDKFYFYNFDFDIQRHITYIDPHANITMYVYTCVPANIQAQKSRSIEEDKLAT